MARQIFVNLPVRDLPLAKTFFASLGFEFNSQISDPNAACMVVAEDISVMLLTEPFFATFTGKPISDARSATEVLLCISCNSREEVDDLVRTAKAAGGSVPREAQDQGSKYWHGFEDLDGHIWELVYMHEDANQTAG